MAIKEVTEYRVTAHDSEGFVEAGVFDTMLKAQTYKQEVTAKGLTTKFYIETYLEPEVDWTEVKMEKWAHEAQEYYEPEEA